MKRVIVFVAIAAILAATLCTVASCGGQELVLYVPDGAPALSIAKIIGEGKLGGGATLGSQKVRTVVSTGENVVAKCGSGEADMAVLPTNAAVKICSSRSDYVLFSVNVQGVLYIVGTQPAETLGDLQGKRLFSIGLGNTPEYLFKAVCDKQGVGYREYDGANTLYGEVMLRYFADASEIIPQVLQGKADYALLGEPAATQLMGKLVEQGKQAYMLFDLQQLWQDAIESSSYGYPQACLIVRKSLCTSQLQRRLDSSLNGNADYLQAKMEQLGEILRSAGSTLTVQFTPELISRCNVSYRPAEEARQDIEAYLAQFDGMQQFLPLADIFWQTKGE